MKKTGTFKLELVTKSNHDKVLIAARTTRKDYHVIYSLYADDNKVFECYDATLFPALKTAYINFLKRE
ncbi:MAG: hypothetical protein WC401_11905 [Bacteroidales bacterium]